MDKKLNGYFASVNIHLNVHQDTMPQESIQLPEIDATVKKRDYWPSGEYVLLHLGDSSVFMTIEQAMDISQKLDHAVQVWQHEQDQNIKEVL